MPENNNFDFENLTQEASGEENSPEVNAETQESQNNEENFEEQNFKEQNEFTGGGYYAPPVNHTYVTYIPYGLTPETYEERKSIKKLGAVIGGSFLLSHLIVLIIGFAVVIGIQFLSFSMPKAANLLDDPAFLHAQQIFLSMFMFTVPFIAIFKFSGYRISSLIEFNKPEKGLFLPFFIFGIGFCSFSNIAMGYAQQFFSNIGINYDVDFGENPKGIFGFLLAFISTAIVPALVEEFACRGLVLGSLRKYGDGFAVFVSSILFGAMHGNFDQIPFAFLIGLVLGFVTVQSGSIIPAMVIHASNNSISLIIDYFLNTFSMEIKNTIYALFLCVSMVLGIVSFFLLKEKTGIFKFKEKKEKQYCSDKQKYKWFFTSALIIIYLSICLIEALAFFAN